ncbi:MAG: hypothetical protein GX757_06920 [Clostridiales bacterium]|nr:hypothetical protein [Clostridiales bacterium]
MNIKNKEIFDFAAQTLILFAFTILILIFLASLFGEGAKELSPLFQLGSKGLASSTIMQFLLSSAIITALKKFFFSERIFKRMMTLWRTVFMLFSIFISSVIFIIIFNWFPLDYAMGWAGFIICFGGSCIIISAFLIIKNKIESRRYTALLDDYKRKHTAINDEE